MEVKVGLGRKIFIATRFSALVATIAVAITITFASSYKYTSPSLSRKELNLLLESRLFPKTNYDVIPWNKHFSSNVKRSLHAQALLCKLKAV